MRDSVDAASPRRSAASSSLKECASRKRLNSEPSRRRRTVGPIDTPPPLLRCPDAGTTASTPELETHDTGSCEGCGIASEISFGIFVLRTCVGCTPRPSWFLTRCACAATRSTWHGGQWGEIPLLHDPRRTITREGAHQRWQPRPHVAGTAAAEMPCDLEQGQRRPARPRPA